MAVIPVELAGRSYEVRVGSGLLANVAEECGPLLRKQRVPIISDANVTTVWREAVDASLIAAGFEPRWKVVAPGEATKCWDVLTGLVEWLLEEGVERGDHIMALGGGVIGDLTGFAAAILKRGCGFIQLPTSLLAQVDSSVGGKTAINSPQGKNLIGAFHQPSLVLADLDALATLPEREMRAGYAEVVKYGVLGDPEFFAWCEANGAAVLSGDKDAQEYAVAQSVAAKARIVAQDERETTGTRALLNLGHTFGHALEAQTGFSQRLLHGEGVALGIILAARFSANKGLMSSEKAERIAAHVRASDMPASLRELRMNCDGARLVEHMLHDKKMDAGTLPFILLRDIGEAFVDKSVALEDVTRFMDEQLQSG